MSQSPEIDCNCDNKVWITPQHLYYWKPDIFQCEDCGKKYQKVGTNPLDEEWEEIIENPGKET